MLINLALAEFLIAFVGVPMDVLPLLHDKWVPEKDLCITTGTIVTTTGIDILICYTIKIRHQIISNLFLLTDKWSMTRLIFLRLRFNDDTYRSVHLSHGCIFSCLWYRWKSFVLQIIPETSFCNLVVLIYSFIASNIWLGKICTRAFWSWVRI